MAGLTRRQFIATAGAAASAFGLSLDDIGHLLAEPAALDRALWRSSLDETILFGPIQTGQYRTLKSGPGEPHIPRFDVLRRSIDDGRAQRRRSILYLAHLSDLHLIDAQSPGRIEPMIELDHSTWGGAFRPQDPLSPHAVAAMVQGVNDNAISPITGSVMSAAVVTGDSADMHSHLELRWYIDILDGVPVDPASGGPTYQGVQAWSEATWAYRPEDPTGGAFGDYGFPRLPTLLQDAISTPVASPGIQAPWYAVYGNHDTILFGTFNASPEFHALAIGGQKAATLRATLEGAIEGWAGATSAWQQGATAFGLSLGGSGYRAVTANPARYIYDNREFIAEHFNTEPDPGPIGHGFTQRNLDTGETWWSDDLSPHVRALGLDTCNAVAGPDGAFPQDQFDWLRGELERATAEHRLVLILSHHNSQTMENAARRPGHDQRLIHSEEFIDLLLQYPVAVAWLNGHTHNNQILAHTSRTGGFWEITTASCIDFPQQQQMVELIDNRDGTLSIFTTVVDHAAPITPTGAATTLDLAARSRELSANDWAETPWVRRGSALDRNTELLLPAPFDLSIISDAALEAVGVKAAARRLDRERSAWEDIA